MFPLHMSLSSFQSASVELRTVRQATATLLLEHARPSPFSPLLPTPPRVFGRRTYDSAAQRNSSGVPSNHSDIAYVLHRYRYPADTPLSCAHISNGLQPPTAKACPSNPCTRLNGGLMAQANWPHLAPFPACYEAT